MELFRRFIAVNPDAVWLLLMQGSGATLDEQLPPPFKLYCGRDLHGAKPAFGAEIREKACELLALAV